MEKPVLLIVDDDPDVLEYTHSILCDEYHADTASGVEEALHFLQRFRYDILLTDLVMPKQDGIALIKKAKEIDPDILAIVLSGQGQKTSVISAMREGAIDFIEKPFKVEYFMNSIERYAEKVRKRKHEEALKEDYYRNQRVNSIGQIAMTMLDEMRVSIQRSSVAAKKIQVSHENQKFLKTILSQARYLEGVMSCLEELNRPMIQEKLVQELVSVQDVISNVLKLLSSQIEEHEIEVRIEIPEDLKVASNKVDVTNVLFCLATNAIEAISKLPERWISFGYRIGREKVEIQITDSGKGIPEKHIGKIFTESFSTKNRDKAMWSSLYRIKDLLEASDGLILLDYTNEHTRFLVHLNRHLSKPHAGPLSETSSF